jgi:hypothetical protein
MEILSHGRLLYGHCFSWVLASCVKQPATYSQLLSRASRSPEPITTKRSHGGFSCMQVLLLLGISELGAHFDRAVGLIVVGCLGE